MVQDHCWLSLLLGCFSGLVLVFVNNLINQVSAMRSPTRSLHLSVIQMLARKCYGCCFKYFQPKPV